MDIFTAISICTGYDGIGLGLKQVIPNLRTICYVEREAYAICNLVAKIKSNQLDDAPIWDDLATFDGRPFKGLVDVFHGGIPCQPWSTAGKQKGIEDERWIWTDVFRIIQEIRPVYVLLEEVPGFVRGGGLGYVLSDLAKAGYDAEWDCFTAAEVGASHKRERLFILAYSQCQRPQGRVGMGESERLAESSMAYSEQQRLRGRGNGISTGLCRQVQAERPSELGNAEDLRLQEQCQTGQNQVEFDRTNKKYPARPGQPQYEWEEPRTLEREVGRADDEHTTELDECVQVNTWVDEIRMCGNGVVPDCAALAWTTLTKRLGVIL